MTCCQRMNMLRPPTAQAHTQQSTLHSMFRSTVWVATVAAIVDFGCGSGSFTTSNALQCPISYGINAPWATHRWPETCRLTTTYHFRYVLTKPAHEQPTKGDGTDFNRYRCFQSLSHNDFTFSKVHRICRFSCYISYHTRFWNTMCECFILSNIQLYTLFNFVSGLRDGEWS